MSDKRNIKCSKCEYGQYLSVSDAYTCNHKECKEANLFKGKTHPHGCPLVGGKKYSIHKNVSRGTANLAHSVMTHIYIS